MSKIDIINLGSNSENNEKKQNDKRLVVYGVFDGVKPDKRLLKKLRPVYFYQDYLEYTNQDYELIKILYEDVQSVKLSMCSRFLNLGIYSEFKYYIDMDLSVGDHICKFELHNIQTMNYLIDIIKNQQFDIQDEIGVMKIFEEHPDYLTRHRWLQKNFKKIAQDYRLDHPRGGMNTNLFSNY